MTSADTQHLLSTTTSMVYRLPCRHPTLCWDYLGALEFDLILILAGKLGGRLMTEEGVEGGLEVGMEDRKEFMGRRLD